VKKQLLISASAILLMQTAQAAIPPQPEVCPPVAAVQAVGVSRNVVQDDDGLWFTGRRNQMYTTKSHWTFLIGRIPAPNASQAYNKAAAALGTLTFVLGPFFGPFGKWVCNYNTGANFPAVAINPPLTDNLEAMFLNAKP
jgi:hypothetical protein